MARFEFTAEALAGAAGLSVGADALFELGLMYCTGRDVELDLIEAHKWFNLAALKGSSEARFYRSEIARELTRSEVATAQRRAREWLTVH